MSRIINDIRIRYFRSIHELRLRDLGDPRRVGRDASRIADEAISHLTGLIGADVRVPLEVEANIPAGVSDHVVRTVTENCRTLKFTSQGFEKE